MLVAAIASAVSFFFALGMDESRATSLLARKVKAIKKSSGQSQLKTASEGSKVTVSSFGICNAAPNFCVTPLISIQSHTASIAHSSSL